MPRVLAQQEDRLTVLFREGEGRPIVVKMSPKADEFGREVRARTLLAKAGMPVLLPSGHQRIAPSTLTLPWIPGDALSERHPRAVCERVGALLARVHAVRTDSNFGGNATWSQWMAGWSRHALAWWRAAPPGEDVANVGFERALADLGPSMDAACDGAILFDGRPDHFIVGADEQVSMIDVEELRTGDPAMDVAVLGVWIPQAVSAIVAGFIAAGGRTGELFDERVRYYTILRTLAAAEWHRDHLNDDRTSKHLLDTLNATRWWT
nr:aminoglycoside phosphotransferase family protein [Planctomonas sp. JC2975]